MTTTPRAWLCAMVQEDGSVNSMFVEQDPAGLRFGDIGEPSPFRVTPLYGQAAIDTLQSAIDRLRDDRNCEKRIRKDAEAAREDLIVEVARLNAEVASLLSGVRIRIPTRAMDQEIATHERRVVALERERCASLAESWPNYHISVTSIGPQIARQIRGAKP